MINTISKHNMIQNIHSPEKNIQSVNFKSNSNNSLEKIPTNDSVVIENKNKKGKKIAIGTVVLAAIGFVADLALAEGRHIKKILGYAQKEAPKTNNIANTSKEIKPVEITDKAKKIYESHSEYLNGKLDVKISDKKSKELAKLEEYYLNEEIRIKNLTQKRKENRKIATLINKDIKKLNDKEVDIILKKYFGEQNHEPAKELIEFIRKEIAPNLDESINFKQFVKTLKVIEKEQDCYGLYKKILSDNKLAYTKMGDLTMLEFIDGFLTLPKESTNYIKQLFINNEIPLDLTYNQYIEAIVPEVMEATPILKFMIEDNNKNLSKSFIETTKAEIKSFFSNFDNITNTADEALDPDKLKDIATKLKPKGPVS